MKFDIELVLQWVWSESEFLNIKTIETIAKDEIFGQILNANLSRSDLIVFVYGLDHCFCIVRYYRRFYRLQCMN